MTSPKQRDPDNWLPPPPWEGLPPLFGAPWERQDKEEPRAPRRVATDRPQVKPASTGLMYSGGPGCKAADATLLNLSYLEGLSRGLGGFGVLRVGRERLEEGAKAAQQLGHADLAREMRAIAEELPQVRDATNAAALADRLRPVADRAWSLGASCKGAMTSQQLGRVRELSRQVQAGTLSMEQAIKQVRQEE